MRVDDIARDVGISKRTLYEQFRTKQDMARAALERRFERLEAELSELLAATGKVSTRLRAMVAAHARVHGDPNAALARDVAATPVLNELVQSSRMRSHALIDQLISRGIADASFRKNLDVGMARRTLLMAVEGMIGAAVFGDANASVEPATAAVFDVVLAGMATGSGRGAVGGKQAVAQVG